MHRHLPFFIDDVKGRRIERTMQRDNVGDFHQFVHRDVLDTHLTTFLLRIEVIGQDPTSKSLNAVRCIPQCSIDGDDVTFMMEQKAVPIAPVPMTPTVFSYISMPSSPDRV